MLCRWIKAFPADFASKEMAQLLSNFTKRFSNAANSPINSDWQAVTDAYAQLNEHPGSQPQSALLAVPTQRARATSESADAGTIPYSVLKIAQQLTLRESAVFGRITPSQLLSMSWMKSSEKNEPAAEVMKMAEMFNHVSSWVSTAIVSVGNVDERAETVEDFIDLIRELEQLRNFNGMLEVRERPVCRWAGPWVSQR